MPVGQDPTPRVSAANRPIAAPDQPGRGYARRAFVTLFLILAAHSMTETARDALFLSRLPINKLPWMYLLVGIASFFIARGTTVLAPHLRCSILPALLAIASVISGGFWAISWSRSAAFLYVLYLWPAVFSSVVVVEFWRAISDAYTITEAKKIFGWLGAGGTAGAAVGSALAVAISARLPAAALLLTAGVLLALAVPFSLASAAPPLGSGADLEAVRLSDFEAVYSSPYLRRVAACVLLATVMATYTDFLFK